MPELAPESEPGCCASPSESKMSMISSPMFVPGSIEPNLVSRRPSVDNDVARIALLGSGTVGLAVLRRLAQWQGTGLGDNVRLVFAANTRLALCDDLGLDPLEC